MNLLEQVDQKRIELGLKKHTTSKAMQNAAKRGLRMAKAGKADPSKVQIARKIASGQKLTNDHVAILANYHAGHDCDSGTDDMCMGGPAGAQWSSARAAAIDASQLAEDRSPLSLDDSDKLALEIYVRDGMGESTELDEENKELIWAPILRSGMLATRPGPNGEKVKEPLIFVPGKASDPRKEVGLENLLDSFKKGAIQHVTVPTSHENDVLSNTGFIKDMKIVESKKRPGEKVLMAAHDIKDPDVRRKMGLGTIANRSCGILYDYVNTETGESYDQAIEHVALTNKPWVTGMAAYGEVSEDDLSELQIVPMLLAEAPRKKEKSEGDPPLRKVELPTSTNHKEFLAEVQWGADEPSLNEIQSAVFEQLEDYGQQDPEDPYPLWTVLDVTTDKALVRCDYGDEDDSQDAWVIPLSSDGGEIHLSDFSQWTPVEQQWVTDEDADQDRKELAATLGDKEILSDDLKLATLTSKERDELPDSSFVFPDEKGYPIPDLAHGRNALARAAQNETGARLQAVRNAVYKKFPQLKSDSKKSNLSLPSDPLKGGAVMPTDKEVLERLELSDEQKAVFQKLVESNHELKSQLGEVTKESREQRVKTRVKDLQEQGFTPGFCKRYEEIALGDDGQVAAVLNLSEDGQQGVSRDYTATEIAESLIAAMPKDDSGKLALAERGNLMTSPISDRSPINREEADKIEERNGVKKPQTADEWLAEAEKVAPGVASSMNLADHKED